MVKIPTSDELFEAMVYYGHCVSKRHPKMEPYLFGAKNNVHLIDLEKTINCLKGATDFVKELVVQGGVILFVGTKPAAREIIKKYAEEAGAPYVIERWLGGTLTNFSVIEKLIKKMKKMEEERGNGEWDKYTKKEKINLERELNRLNIFVGGLRNLERIPEAIYIVDLRKEKTAVREAKRAKVKTVALVDTNCNPAIIDYPIPGNDDAIRSIELITKTISEAIKEGRGKVNKTKAKKEKEK